MLSSELTDAAYAHFVALSLAKGQTFFRSHARSVHVAGLRASPARSRTRSLALGSIVKPSLLALRCGHGPIAARSFVRSPCSERNFCVMEKVDRKGKRTYRGARRAREIACVATNL